MMIGLTILHFQCLCTVQRFYDRKGLQRDSKIDTQIAPAKEDGIKLWINGYPRALSKQQKNQLQSNRNWQLDMLKYRQVRIAKGRSGKETIKNSMALKYSFLVASVCSCPFCSYSKITGCIIQEKQTSLNNKQNNKSPGGLGQKVATLFAMYR